MKIAGEWLKSEATQALLSALNSADRRALFVGGCVRNAILGVPVGDIDIATDAHPEDVLKIAAKAGFRAIPTGIEFGTVTVVVGDLPHEVTTLRRDIETNGRHAVVAYSNRLEDDAARRDFTMNALYADADGTVIDPLGGLPDLLARRVRFVGVADARINEDFLRILRFFRFHAIYGDPDQGIDPDGLAACAANTAGIDTLSKERIGTEMRKLLSAVDPAPALAAMDQAGVLLRVLPGANPSAIPVLVHLERGNPRGWLCRLAILGGQNAAGRLRLSRADASVHDRIRAGIGSEFAADALGWQHGLERAGDILYARAALSVADLPDDWQAEARRGTLSTFPVTAADLLHELQGPELGRKLHELQQRWLSSGLSLTRDQLLAQ